MFKKKKMEEEVLDKNKGKESKRDAFRGRGAPLEWRGRGTQKQETQNKKVRRRLLGKNFLLVTKYNLQRRQSKQEESTEQEEVKQQPRIVLMKDLIRKKTRRKSGCKEPMMGG